MFLLPSSEVQLKNFCYDGALLARTIVVYPMAIFTLPRKRNPLYVYTVFPKRGEQEGIGNQTDLIKNLPGREG